MQLPDSMVNGELKSITEAEVLEEDSKTDGNSGKEFGERTQPDFRNPHIFGNHTKDITHVLKLNTLSLATNHLLSCCTYPKSLLYIFHAWAGLIAFTESLP